MRIAQLARCEIDGDGVDGEVAAAEGRERREVVDVIPLHDAPGDQVAAAELDDLASQALRDGERVVAFDVDVVRLAAEKEIADRAADGDARASGKVL